MDARSESALQTREMIARAWAPGFGPLRVVQGTSVESECRVLDNRQALHPNPNPLRSLEMKSKIMTGSKKGLPQLGSTAVVFQGGAISSHASPVS